MSVRNILPYAHIEHEHELVYEVVWSPDGRGTSATRYLDAVEEARPPQKPLETGESMPTKVERELDARGPLTLGMLAAHLGKTTREVNSGIQVLIDRGRVAVVAKIPASRAFGNHHHNVYGLVEKTVDTARGEA